MILSRITPEERQPRHTRARNVKVGDRVLEYTHSSGPIIQAFGEVIYVGPHFYRVRFTFRGGSYTEAYPLYIATGLDKENGGGS